MVGKLLSYIRRIWESVKSGPVNLRRRLLAFLLLLIFTMLAMVMFLLSLFGVFMYSSGETEKLMQSELDHLSSQVSIQYGAASVQAAKMSERLSADIEGFMRREGLQTGNLKNNPSLLEPLLAELLPTLQSSLNAVDCSGVFMALDTTVNPAIEGAEHSKAGLYIRSIDPNIGGMRHDTRYLLRGPSGLAGSGRLNLQMKWDLEFNVADQLFWLEPIKAHQANPSLPLSRLLYWCSMSPIQGLNDDVMICSVPMLDGDGGILGVCGFEIYQMNFMLRYEPKSSDLQRAVFLFSSMTDNGLRLEDALFAGNFAIYDKLPRQEIMRHEGHADGFRIYGINGGGSFVGMEKQIRLYPEGSPNAGKLFAAALLLFKAEFDAAQNAARIRFGLILFALMAMGIAASVFLSKRFVKPITD